MSGNKCVKLHREIEWKHTHGDSGEGEITLPWKKKRKLPTEENISNKPWIKSKSATFINEICWEEKSLYSSSTE